MNRLTSRSLGDQETKTTYHAVPYGHIPSHTELIIRHLRTYFGDALEGADNPIIPLLYQFLNNLDLQRKVIMTLTELGNDPLATTIFRHSAELDLETHIDRKKNKMHRFKILSSLGLIYILHALFGINYYELREKCFMKMQEGKDEKYSSNSIDGINLKAYEAYLIYGLLYLQGQNIHIPALPLIITSALPQSPFVVSTFFHQSA